MHFKVPDKPADRNHERAFVSCRVRLGPARRGHPRGLYLVLFLCSYDRPHRVLWQRVFILKTYRGNVVPSRKGSHGRSQRPRSVTECREERVAGDSWGTNKFDREEKARPPGGGRC